MRSYVGSVKLGSSGLWPAILTLAMSVGVGCGLVGCIITDDDSDRHRSGSDRATDKPPPADTPEPTDTPLQVAIDADQALESLPGDGVGVFVEYVTGGHWHVWTSCDTNSSDAVCAFDVFVTVADGPPITNSRTENLEGSDIIEKKADGSLHLIAKTSAELDGMTFDTDAGAVIELEAYFDNELDPRVLYWFGDGVLHQGAPTNPIQFKPTAP
jgi:hypothetical protein